MTLLIKDGGMTSAALQTQIVGGEHIPSQNVLGSVAIVNVPAVTIIGPSSVAVTGGTVALSGGTAILGSVNVGGSIAVLNFPATPVTQVQFGLSSTVVGQRTMALSIPITLASDQPAIAVTGAGGQGSVNVLGGSIALLAGTAQVGAVDVRATGLSSVAVVSQPPVQVTPVQFGLSSVVTGPRTMSLSLSVTMASDQPAIAVSGAAGAGSVNVLGGAIQLIGPALVTPAQFGLSSVVTGQRTMALSIPMTLASDQPAIPVTGNFTAAGGVQLVQFGFSSVTPGQKTMAFSIPVTLASDQPTISVSGTFQAADVQRVQFGTSSTVVGQRTMALSIPFTLASDQPAIAVTGAVGSGSVNVLGGSVGLLAGTAQVGSVDVRATGTSSVALLAGTAILGSVNVGGGVSVLSMPAVQVTPVQFGFSSATLGQKTMTLSIPFTLASDQPAMIGTQGQTTMSLSIPMTLASDQPPLPVGGIVQITNPPAFSDGIRAERALDYLGKTIVWPFAVRGLAAMGTCALQGTTETTLVAAGGSTVYHDLTMLVIAGASSTFSGVAQIRGATGSAILMRVKYGPSDDVRVVMSRPMEAPGKNMNWTVQLTQTPPNSVFVTAQVVKLI